MIYTRKKSSLRSCSAAEKLILDMLLQAYSLERCTQSPEFIVRSGTQIRIPVSLIDDLLKREFLIWKGQKLLLTDASRSWANAHLSPTGTATPFKKSTQPPSQCSTRQNRARIAVNPAESPLDWLKSRQGKGTHAITHAGFSAGERLRRDFTIAQLSPRITTNWAPPEQRSTAGDPLLFSDAVLAARQRFSRAMEAVGPEFQNVLMDVVCFLKGLEQIEKERQWPARSAKIVLGLGLERLARHYGIASVAQGNPRSDRIRSWTAPSAKQA